MNYMTEIYLDNSATTRQLSLVTEAMAEVFSHSYGNPSSLHKKGIEGEKLLKESRSIIANTLGKNASCILFNSGGTEGDNNVLQSVARDRKRMGRTIVTTAVEHPAVLETCDFLQREGFRVIRLPVDEYCRISLDDLKEALSEDVILISVMTVNNEVGTIFPIEDIVKIRDNLSKALVHTDAVQAYGKMDLSNFRGDFLNTSAHKIHGPKGVGFLYKKEGVKLSPMIFGGNQEGGLRSGTENLPGIVGFAKAAELADANREKNFKAVDILWHRLREGLDEISDTVFNSPEDGLPYILNVSFLGTRGEVILHDVESKGVYISTGSACSSNKKSRSHVLKAMGKSKGEIDGAVRFSLSHLNTEEEIDKALDIVESSVKRFRKLGSFR